MGLRARRCWNKPARSDVTGNPRFPQSDARVLPQRNQAVEEPEFCHSRGRVIHVSAYGLYGFAMLSSTDFRRTMRFAMHYHQLAAPLVEVLYREEGGQGIWSFAPLPDSLDRALSRFLGELQLSAHMSLQRDLMGRNFVPHHIGLKYCSPDDVPRLQTSSAAWFCWTNPNTVLHSMRRGSTENPNSETKSAIG